VVLVYFLYRRVNAADFVEQRLEYRLFAEALRVQIYWSTSILSSTSTSELNQLDLAPTNQSARVVEAFLRQQLHEIGWIKEGLRTCGVGSQVSLVLGEQFKKDFARHWISDQLSYFKRREKDLHQLVINTNRVSILFYVLGVITLLLTILFDTVLHVNFGKLRHETAVIAAVAPAIFLLIQNYIEKTAADEQIQNYRRMSKVFSKAKKSLAAEKLSNDEFNYIILETGKEAITEGMNWLILKKSKRVSFTL
jgi:di/tricarboxylate transporter